MRAEAWAERLAAVLAETGAERLNLVGFSSGGLDARVLARDPDWAGRIASLVTVSTPHRGTALADYVLGRPDRLRSVAVAVMDFVGRAAYETAPPRSETAIAELAPDAVAARFPPDETVADAWCASYASRAGKGTAHADVPAARAPQPHPARARRPQRRDRPDGVDGLGRDAVHYSTPTTPARSASA